MRMKKTAIIVLAIGLPIVLIGGFLLWFFSPGVHIVGRFAHLDIQKDCYYVDMDSGEILGESILTLDCDTNPLTDMLSGSVCLPEYPVEGDVSRCAFTKREGYLSFAYSGVRFGPGDDGNITSFVDFGYYIYVKDAEHIFAVTKTKEDLMVLAVCADSEQEALEKGKIFYRVHSAGLEPSWNETHSFSNE